MDEEITPDEITPDDLPPSDLIPVDDATTFIVEEIVDNRTLMGTLLNYVFGNLQVTMFIVSVMILVTLLIISTDFMRWKGRD